MDELINYTISGAVTGTIFSLIAAGLTLSYSATGIFNLSYGAIAFTSSLLYYELHSGAGWAVLPAAVLTILLFAPALGALLNLAVFRPLARASDAAKIMATVGLLIALPGLARFLTVQGIELFDWSIADPSQIRAQAGIWRTPPEVWNLGGVRLNSNDLVMLLCAVVVAVLLYVLMQRTRLGLQMRAVVDRPALAELRGVDEGVTSYSAWMVGAALAALAGVAGAPYFGPLLAERYTQFVFIAATAVVLGRLRSIPLAFVGGLVIGILKNYVAAYADFADEIQGFENSVPFVLMLLGLLVLGRDRSRRGGSAAEEVPPPDHLADLPTWRRRLPWAVATSGLLVLIFFVLDDFWLDTVTYGLALGLVFMSFVLVTGMGGMVSLAQATFVTSGGMVAGMLINRYDVPFWPALFCGAAAAVVLGLVVALPSLRLGGLPLALATLALALVGDSVLFQWDWLRNGQRGWTFDRPSIGPFDFEDSRTMAVFLLIFSALVAVVVRNLQQSSAGRAIVAVRASTVAAATSGISVVRSKLAIFSLAAGLAGLGGVLVTTYRGNITNTTFPAQLGLLWLATTVLFGVRRPGGAVVAGLVSACTAIWLRSGFTLPGFLPDWNGAGDDWSDISAILFGLGAVQLARNPDGVLAITGLQNQGRRQRRAARRDARADAVGSPGAGVGAATTPPTAAVVGADVRLVLQGVRAGYGPVEVLHGIDLELRRGTITALLGPNGAGKSTLCQTIAGLVPVRGGRIVADGLDVTGRRGRQRARAGVVLAPESRGVFPGLTVEENLVLWLPDSRDRRAVYDRFPMLGDRRSVAAGNLSGGEQQILTLAPLLQRRPDVLVADEPSLGLAPLIVGQVLGLLGELRDAGVALLLVEEKARDVVPIADTVAFLELGAISWSGPRDDLDEARLTTAYLGS